MNLRDYYINKRVEEVDPDFLEFEEDKISKEDLALILNLLSEKKGSQRKFPNPYNSIILYVTGLTNEFDFRRARADTIGGSFADADLDFDPRRRKEIFDFIINKYGRECTAQIGTYGTFKPRSIVRRYCSITEKSDEDTAAILRNIPKPAFGKEPTLEEVVAAMPELATDSKYRELYQVAQAFENMTATASIHAAGIVFTDDPITGYIPVSLKESEYVDGENKKHKERTWVTQYDMSDVESCGVLKLDLLVIDNLSVVDECLRLIKERHNIDIEIYKIEDGDKEAYGIINSGMLSGIFQLETSGVTWDIIQKVQPSSISEISDITSLIRPGPRQAGMDEQYWKREPDNNIPQKVQELWADTRGVLVYQEQVLALCRDIAGYNLVDADSIRRLIGKKKTEEMKKIEPEFKERLKTYGKISDKEADYLWETLLGCASYLLIRQLRQETDVENSVNCGNLLRASLLKIGQSAAKSQWETFRDYNRSTV